MSVIGVLSRAVPDAVLARLLPVGRTFDPRRPVPVPSYARNARARVLIAPENSAGQGERWARALESNVEGVSAQCLAVDRGGPFQHAADIHVPAPVFAWSRQWQRRLRRRVASTVTHVLVESGRSVLAGGSRGDLARELRWCRRRGIEVAFIWHGSDVRDPDRHAAQHPFSPYRDRAWESVPGLRASSARNRRLAAESAKSSFVSTPDLLDDVPGAVWLPVVIDAARWSTAAAPLSHGGRLRVVHAPSRGVVKGTALIEPALHELHRRGVIEYRRIEGVPHDRMPAVVRDADVVLDQFRLGSYGVAAVEAMAAGRILIGDVTVAVRDAAERVSGMPLPLIGVSPDSIGSVLEGIVRDPSCALALAASGPNFVRAVHDGRLSAAALGAWIAPSDGVDAEE